MREQVSITMNDFEQRVLVRSLNEFRNFLIENDYPTEDVDDMIHKVVEARPMKRRPRVSRDER